MDLLPRWGLALFCAACGFTIGALFGVIGGTTGMTFAFGIAFAGFGTIMAMSSTKTPDDLD